MLLSIPKDILLTQVLSKLLLEDLQRLAATCSRMAMFVRTRLHACQKMYINLFLNMSVICGRDCTKTYDLDCYEYWTICFSKRAHSSMRAEIDPHFWSTRETQRPHFFVGFSISFVAHMKLQPWFSELEKYRIQFSGHIRPDVYYLYNTQMENNYLLPGCCVQGLLCRILREQHFYLSFACKRNLQLLHGCFQNLFGYADTSYYKLDFVQFLEQLRDKNVEHRPDLFSLLQLPRTTGNVDHLAEIFPNPFNPPSISSQQHLFWPSIVETDCADG